MGIFGNLIFLCWAVFLVYWTISSFSVKETQERAWPASRFRWIMITIFVVALILVHFWLIPAVNPSCRTNSLDCHIGLNIFNSSHTTLLSIKLISVFVTFLGLIVAIIARKTLADNWSGNIEIKKGHELITSGIYGYIRHPIYTGVLLMGIGTLIFTQTLILILFVFGMSAFFIFKLTREEKLLTKHFPKEYPAYKKRVKALIPFVL